MTYVSQDITDPKYRRIKLSNEKFRSVIIESVSPLGLQLFCCGPGFWHLTSDGMYMESVGYQTAVSSANEGDEKGVSLVWKSWLEKYSDFLDEVSNYIT